MTIFLIILGVILALVVGVYAYYGGFRSVKFRIENQGGEILIFKEMKGDYAKSGVVMDEIYKSLLQDYGIETYKGFGLYYDDPRKVEKENLRSEIGCILEPKDSASMERLKEKFKVKILDTRSYIVTEFPHKGKLSVFVGLMKIYPALNKYVSANGCKSEGAVMEIYDVPHHKIIYRKEKIK